jgi:homoprotocatechuate degradation regulator HpaR
MTRRRTGTATTIKNKSRTKSPRGSGIAAQLTAELGASAPFSERSLPVSLLRAREAVMTHMRPILRSHGTTEQQWRVLRALNETVPLDKTSLADRSALLMPSLLRILKDLQRAGLIRLVKSTSNARLSGVALTASGSDHVQEVSGSLAAMGQVVRTAVGADLVEELLDLLGEVEARLRELKPRRPDPKG